MQACTDLDLGVLLLQEVAIAINCRRDVDEQGSLEDGTRLVVDGLLARLGGVGHGSVQRGDVEDCHVAGAACSLDVHSLNGRSAVHCTTHATNMSVLAHVLVRYAIDNPHLSTVQGTALHWTLKRVVAEVCLAAKNVSSGETLHASLRLHGVLIGRFKAGMWICVITWLGLGWAWGDLLLVASTVGKCAKDILQGGLHEVLGLVVHLQCGQRWRLLRLRLQQSPLAQGGCCAKQHQSGHHSNIHLSNHSAVVFIGCR